MEQIATADCGTKPLKGNRVGGCDRISLSGAEKIEFRNFELADENFKFRKKCWERFAWRSRLMALRIKHVTRGLDLTSPRNRKSKFSSKMVGWNLVSYRKIFMLRNIFIFLLPSSAIDKSIQRQCLSHSGVGTAFPAVSCAIRAAFDVGLLGIRPAMA